MLCQSHLGLGLLGVCVMRLRAPGCGWGALVVSAAALLVLAAVGLALVLLLTRESHTFKKNKNKKTWQKTKPKNLAWY